MLAELPHVEEGRVEALELLLGDDSGPYIREKEAYVLSASKSLIMSQLACPVDDVEEHLGVVLQPHGEVVELLCLPHEGAPHVDPLVDGDARLLLGLGLVWMPKEESRVRVSQSLCKCNRRRNIN